MTPEDHNRLDRIESKLDKVAEALFSLARMEEKMVSLFRRMDSYDTEQKRLVEKVALLEATSSGESSKLEWVERLIWVGLVAVVTFYVNTTGA